MKVRHGFVSNSSSSSFICVVCGDDYSGWDASLSDAEMFDCVNGHTVCLRHAIGYIEEANEDFPYSVESKHCPICNFVSLEENSAFKYLLKETGKTKDTLLKEIKERFKNYDEYMEYLK